MADDGDYIEEFNITESDLDSAFNPTRRRGRQSKEEAIYGKIYFRLSRNFSSAIVHCRNLGNGCRTNIESPDNLILCPCIERDIICEWWCQFGIKN